MGWQWGSIPLLVYTPETPIITVNALLETDNTPFLLTDDTELLLAGS